MILPGVEIEKINTLQDARNAIEKLVGYILKLQQENESLKAEIRRLKGQPGKPQFVTQDSNQKPAVTGLLKEKHTWHKRSKKKDLPIDRKEALPETDRCPCGSDHFIIKKTFEKLVQGVIFQRDNVAYQGRVKQCVNCGKTYRSQLPLGLKGKQFSPQLGALLSYLVYACRLTQPLIQKLFFGLQIKISSGQISKTLLENGQKLNSACQQLKTQGIESSSYLQTDATGAKRQDQKTRQIKNQHVQVVANPHLSLFEITTKYNRNTVNQVLTQTGRDKLLISDDGSPNGNRLTPNRQLCWVHEIRHYKKLFPFFNRHRKLQQQILGQWRQFYHLAKHYGESPLRERSRKRQEIERLFDQIVSQTTGYDLLDKQLQNTSKKHLRLLLFLDHPELPIHNNQCEQDLRHFVIIRKITGGTKSQAGDTSLTNHISIIQTLQKQGQDVLQILTGLLSGSISPAILTANIH